jgi:hypothetical protein
MSANPESAYIDLVAANREIPTDIYKLLQASIDIIEKDNEIEAQAHEIARLKNALAIAERTVAILQCKLQRRTIPFDQRPALLKPQAG